MKEKEKIPSWAEETDPKLADNLDKNPELNEQRAEFSKELSLIKPEENRFEESEKGKLNGYEKKILSNWERGILVKKNIVSLSEEKNPHIRAKFLQKIIEAINSDYYMNSKNIQLFEKIKANNYEPIKEDGCIIKYDKDLKIMFIGEEKWVSGILCKVAKRDILRKLREQAKSLLIKAKENIKAEEQKRGFKYNEKIEEPFSVSNLEEGDILYVITGEGKSIYQFKVERTDEIIVGQKSAFIKYVSGPKTLENSEGYILKPTIENNKNLVFGRSHTSPITHFEIRKDAEEGAEEWKDKQTKSEMIITEKS